MSPYLGVSCLVLSALQEKRVGTLGRQILAAALALHPAQH